MKNLIEGAVAFRQTDYEQHENLFQQLGKGQQPHTLFIGCSDSRLVPAMITATQPGEMFILRNIANIVPPYTHAGGYLAAVSAIEFAVVNLQVQNIIVCGHSNCGGCAALYHPDSFFAEIPHTRKWLELSLPVKEKVLKALPHSTPGAREWLTEQMNVVEQLQHLLSYPFIQQRVEQNTLTLAGWYYIIETGEIFQYNATAGYFELIN